MNLIKNIILVIISPKVGWDSVNHTGTHYNQILRKVFFPLLAVLGLSAFVPMIYDSTLKLTSQFTSGILQCSAFFFDYYIASYLLSGFYPEIVKTDAGMSRLNSFILHILIYLMLLSIISNLLPIDFTPVLFLMVYVIWMAKQGTEFLGLKSDKVAKFIVIASALLLIAPLVINFFK